MKVFVFREAYFVFIHVTTSSTKLDRFFSFGSLDENCSATFPFCSFSSQMSKNKNNFSVS